MCEIRNSLRLGFIKTNHGCNHVYDGSEWFPMTSSYEIMLIVNKTTAAESPSCNHAINLKPELTTCTDIHTLHIQCLAQNTQGVRKEMHIQWNPMTGYWSQPYFVVVLKHLAEKQSASIKFRLSELWRFYSRLISLKCLHWSKNKLIKWEAKYAVIFVKGINMVTKNFFSEN